MGIWEDDGDGRKNMPVAGKKNQTSSLLTQARDGGMKVENILQGKGKGKRMADK